MGRSATIYRYGSWQLSKNN